MECCYADRLLNEDALFVRVTTYSGTFEAGPLLMRAEMLTEICGLSGQGRAAQAAERRG
jgi:hypothetical protein